MFSAYKKLGTHRRFSITHGLGHIQVRGQVTLQQTPTYAMGVKLVTCAWIHPLGLQDVTEALQLTSAC